MYLAHMMHDYGKILTKLLITRPQTIINYNDLCNYKSSNEVKTVGEFCTRTKLTANTYGQMLGVWACARPIFGSRVGIQRSFSVCFDASIIGYCRN